MQMRFARGFPQMRNGGGRSVHKGRLLGGLCRGERRLLFCAELAARGLRAADAHFLRSPSWTFGPPEGMKMRTSRTPAVMLERSEASAMCFSRTHGGFLAIARNDNRGADRPRRPWIGHRGRRPYIGKNASESYAHSHVSRATSGSKVWRSAFRRASQNKSRLKPELRTQFSAASCRSARAPFSRFRRFRRR